MTNNTPTTPTTPVNQGILTFSQSIPTTPVGQGINVPSSPPNISEQRLQAMAERRNQRTRLTKISIRRLVLFILNDKCRPYKDDYMDNNGRPFGGSSIACC